MRRPFIKARWIGGGKIYRARFFLGEHPREKICLRICGLGYFSFSCNGIPFENDELVPVQSNYRDTVYYLDYDLAEHLRPGENELRVVLGEGFYAQKEVNSALYGWGKTFYGERRLIAEISSESHIFAATGVDWQTADGPYLFDNIYAGEKYDAAKEDISESEWKPARPVDPPGGELLPQPIRGEKVYAHIPPVGRKEEKPGCFIFDFGKNIAGRVEITVKAPAGNTITIRYAEELDDEGNIFFASTGVNATGVIPTDIYHTRGGDKEETWRPRFGFRGFRYAEVTCTAGIDSLRKIEAQQIFSILEDAGSFESDDQELNQCLQMMELTLAGCLHSLPMDCPVREKCGWTGDAQVISHWVNFRYDLHAFWHKYMSDVRSSTGSGKIPMVAPGERRCGDACLEWGFVCIAVPYETYCFTGDRSILEENYSLMLDFYENCCVRKSKDGLLGDGLGDYAAAGNVHSPFVSKLLTGTAVWLESAQKISAIANILGDTANVAFFSAEAKKIADSFFQCFYQKDTGSFGSQTGNILALQLHAMPQELEDHCAARLNEEIVNAGYHFNTGILGGKYLTDILCRFGYSDTAAKLFRAKGFPGFQDLIQNGATTLWESWRRNRKDAKSFSSCNHVMQTGYASFFFRSLGGLDIDFSFGAKKHLLYAPCAPAGMRFCRVELKSVHGKIVSTWNRKTPDAPPELTLHVPAGLDVQFRPDLTLGGATPKIIRSDLSKTSLKKL